MTNACVNWTHKVLHWCRADPLAWSTIVTLAPFVLLAVVGPFLPCPTADLLRYAGLILQLLGIATVAKNLADKGVLFNLPRLRDLVRRSRESFPKWQAPQEVNFARAAAAIIPGASGQGRPWRGYDTASTEERVEALIANLEELKTQVANSVAALKTEHDSLQTAVTRHRDERVQEDADLRRRLTGLGTSSIHLDWAGIIWLAVGLVLSTISG